MAEKTAAHSSKTVLDLALELGVRRETVLSTLQKMGLAVDPVMESIGPGVEKELLQQMVSDGLVPTALQKGKGRRKKTSQPLVDDDLVTEALASSESGFNRSKIPHQITFESSFEEKPSFFKRLFGKKNNLVNTIRNQDFSEDQVNTLFSLPVERRSQPDVSPFREKANAKDETPSNKETEQSTAKVLDTPQVKSSLIEQDINAAETEEIEPFNTDGIMEDIDDIELAAESEIEQPKDEEVEGFDDLDDLSDLDTDIDDLDVVEDSLPEMGSFDQEDLKDIPEGEEEEPEEKKGAIAALPTMLDSILSRIQLSQAEAWTLMGGSIAIMLIVLGVTVYWWINYSPESQEKLFEEARGYFEKGEAAEDWKLKGKNLELAVDTYTQFVERYPKNPSVPKAYEDICQAYYDLAQRV